MLTTYQRKFDKIQTLLVNRNYQLTKLQLKSTGAISYFPNPQLQRMMVPSGQTDQNFTFCGTFLRSNKIGATTIFVDRLPALNHPSNLIHKGQSYKSLDSSSTTVSLAYPLNSNTAEKDQLFLDSSVISVMGTYPPGAEAIVVKSKQPILLGDQLLVSDGLNSQDVVVLNVNNPNLEEWDIQLDKPVTFGLTDGNEVVLQMSSACVWLDVPIQNLSYLAVPVATHIADDKALIVTFVRLKSGNKVVNYYYTLEQNTVILGAIPTQAWLTATVDGGVAESQDGTTKLVCESPDGVHARLELLNAIPAGNWLFNIRSVADGYMTICVDGVNYISVDLKAGIQQKLVALDAFNKIEIFAPQTILIGDILPENAPTSLDVVAHVFNQQELGSHVIANPKLVGLTLDPSLTWARTGQAKTNAGHSLNPAAQKIGDIPFAEPVVFVPTSPAGTPVDPEPTLQYKVGYWTGETFVEIQPGWSETSEPIGANPSARYYDASYSGTPPVGIYFTPSDAIVAVKSEQISMNFLWDPYGQYGSSAPSASAFSVVDMSESGMEPGYSFWVPQAIPDWEMYILFEPNSTPGGGGYVDYTLTITRGSESFEIPFRWVQTGW